VAKLKLAVWVVALYATEVGCSTPLPPPRGRDWMSKSDALMLEASIA
jgi:hypothetical protein